MPVADLISRVRSKGREATEAARQMAISVVDGAEVSDEAIAEACRTAGMSFEQFASIMTAAEQRRTAYETFAARSFPAEIEKAVTDYRQSATDRVAVEKEIEVLQAEARRLAGLEQSLAGQRQRLEVEQRAAIETFQAAVGINAPDDWRDF